MNKHIIDVNHEKCIGCGLCNKDCSYANFNIVDDKASAKSNNCLMCGHCVAICPNNAISISGYSDNPIDYDQPTLLDPSQLTMAVKSRRSIRKFLDKDIEADYIDMIIQVGRYTPTARNAQDISYVVLKDNIQIYQHIAGRLFSRLLPLVKIFYRPARHIKIDDNFFFKHAPVAIVIASDDKVSASLAASNMSLMAESLGLGVLYSGFFTIAVNQSRKLRKYFGLGKKKAVTTLVLGYPNIKYRRTVQREDANVKHL